MRAVLIVLVLALAGCTSQSGAPTSDDSVIPGQTEPADSTDAGDEAAATAGNGNSTQPDANWAPPPHADPPPSICQDRLDDDIAHQIVVELTFVSGIGPNGTIRGPWANVTVVLHNETSGANATATTDPDGCASFDNPAPGRYFVAAEAPPSDPASCTPSGRGHTIHYSGGQVKPIVQLSYSDPCA